MSIQFRSRVKSVVDFGADLKSVGTCCFPNGTSQSLTFYECFVNGGVYIAGEGAECPSQGELGNCFACAYLTSDQKSQVIADPTILTSNPSWGTRNVTECECTRIGGVFGTNPADPNNPSRDIRVPKACCYFDYNENNFPVGITCANVCSERECSLIGSQTPEGNLRHTSIYHSGSLCSEVDCTPQNINPNTYSIMAAKSSSYAAFDIGACYDLTLSEGVYSYSCDLKPLHLCSGYWVPPSYGENGVILCNNRYAPQTPVSVEGRVVEPETMREMEFDELGLQIGDEYKGGYYIGKFTVNASYSPVYGSLNMTDQETTYYNDTTPRDIYSRWALIVDYTDYASPLMTSTEMRTTNSRTSNSDGFYNTYGDINNFSGLEFITANTIRGLIRNGFADYYIPSIIELYFLANALRNNSTLSSKLQISNKMTSSSIFYENLTSLNSGKYNFNGVVFTYGQTLNTSMTDFGKTLLIPGTNRGALRFFRKVILT